LIHEFRLEAASRVGSEATPAKKLLMRLSAATRATNSSNDLLEVPGSEEHSLALWSTQEKADRIARREKKGRQNGGPGRKEIEQRD
jgi:hypothetical protein